MISLTSPVETWAHRLPAGAKLLALSLLTVALFLTDRPEVLAAALLAVLALYLSAGATFLRQGAAHLRMLWPFLLLIALWHGLTGQAQAGLAIALRLLAALALANFVTMTTRLTDMIAVLTRLLAPLRRIGLPTRAVELAIAMVLRFTPMLVDNGRRLAMSWRARSPRRPGWRIVMPMAALALDDADHVAEALRARGGIMTETHDRKD
ncbi:CbiQ family ECF transporter T component [Paracoccus benzoatiresistens]|uniref:Energy-coupling factor transporter transmembrane protein EcfT n=1 Tax=Paracoccus benzoatiresistens TaxID=2997341 RepID=A0ABT4IZF4_9RHOB|nr:CbiQ family ECF transporter T component [Paracoccus sp. EF6]MCZ0960250.1 energy-coupling factor transporter transmembrane protein EcfT [Paracoccus sp. EF6]